MRLIKMLLILTVFMFTMSGCTKNKPIEISTDRRDTVQTQIETTEASTLAETELEETTTAVIGKDINIIRKTYESFADFVADANSLYLAEHAMAVGDTQLAALMQRITDTQAMFVDISDVEETVSCVYAVSENNMYVNFDADGLSYTDVSAENMEDAGFNVLAEMTVIVKGHMLYFVDEDTKICYYTEADYADIASLGYTDAIQSILDTSVLWNIDTLNVCIVDIGGLLYQLETYDVSAIVHDTVVKNQLCGYLFDTDGNLCYYKSSDYGVVFNSITEQVSMDIFEISKDFTMISMDDMYGH